MGKEIFSGSFRGFGERHFFSGIFLNFRGNPRKFGDNGSTVSDVSNRFRWSISSEIFDLYFSHNSVGADGEQVHEFDLGLTFRTRH